MQETVDGIQWRYIVEDNQAIIEGSAFGAAINAETTGAIAIPKALGGYPVTSIGEYAFFRCEKVTHVTIGENVKHIGMEAFRECYSLKEVSIPDGVLAIGKQAFLHCQDLERVTIGQGVECIDDDAFAGCHALQDFEVAKRNPKYAGHDDALFSKDGSRLIAWPGCPERPVIPTNVTDIGVGAFKFCKNLTEMTIPDGVRSIGDGAFNSCKKLTRVIIGKNVERIEASAFGLCNSLKEIVIPDSVRSIGDRAFSNDTAMECVVFGNGLACIGEDAFMYCHALTEVTIPDSVEEIGIRAFYGCTGLMTVHIPGAWRGTKELQYKFPKESEILYTGRLSDIPWLFTAKGEEAVLGKDGMRTIDQSTSGAVTIPDQIGEYRVTGIGDEAFKECSRLTKIGVPASVTHIAPGAFTGCERLRAIEVADGNRCFSTRDGVLLSKEPTALLAFPGGKTGAYSIPDDVKVIAPYAFAGCKTLTGVTLSESVEEVGEGAFDGCEALLKIEVSAGNRRYSSKDGVLLDKKSGDLVAYPEGKMDGIPPAEPSPLWEVRDLLLKKLSERKDAFDEWAECHRRAMKMETDDMFFFDELLQVLPHVTLPEGYRLAATVTPDGRDSLAEFFAKSEGSLLPINRALCPDGTPESYWEAFVLWFETDQFYRCGHMNYGRKVLVPDLRSFLQEYPFGWGTGQDVFKSLPQKARWQLCHMDFRPEIEKNPTTDDCNVYYTAFSPFGGFTRYRATFMKYGNAYILPTCHPIERVKYHCSVMF